MLSDNSPPLKLRHIGTFGHDLESSLLREVDQGRVHWLRLDRERFRFIDIRGHARKGHDQKRSNYKGSDTANRPITVNLLEHCSSPLIVRVTQTAGSRLGCR